MGDESIDAILINGRGGDLTNSSQLNAGNPPIPQYDDYFNYYHPGPRPRQPQIPRSEFFVEKGKRYRFRIINAGFLFCPLEFSIEDHKLTLIATDGNPIQPVDVPSFIILAGERVDFILHAFQPTDSYWIKVKGNADCAVDKIFQTAILKYKRALIDTPKNKINFENSGPNIIGKV